MSELPLTKVARFPAIPPNEQAISWRVIATQAAVIWGASRLGLLLLTYFTVILNNRLSPRDIGFVVNGQSFASIATSWERWDAGWYLQIARDGYFRPEAVAFFPLYPLLIHLGSLVLGPDRGYLAAMVIANLGALAGFIGLALLAARESAAAPAGSRTVRILAAWPLAFFLFAPYTEGLFLALATWSLLGARRGWWRTAAACAFFAALTRPTGFALFLPLLWEYGRQRRWWRREWRVSLLESLRPTRLVQAVMVVGAVPLALALYLVYIKLRFGHASLLFNAFHFWDRQSVPLWRTAWLGLKHLVTTAPWSYWQALQLIDDGSVLLFLILIVIAVRRAPLAFTLYSAGVIYLAVSQPIPGIPDVIPSAARYVLVAFPVFLLLGQWSGRRVWIEQVLLSGGFLLQGVLATFFLSSGWVG